MMREFIYGSCGLFCGACGEVKWYQKKCACGEVREGWEVPGSFH